MLVECTVHHSSSCPTCYPTCPTHCLGCSAYCPDCPLLPWQPYFHPQQLRYLLSHEPSLGFELMLLRVSEINCPAHNLQHPRDTLEVRQTEFDLLPATRPPFLFLSDPWSVRLGPKATWLKALLMQLNHNHSQLTHSHSKSCTHTHGHLLGNSKCSKINLQFGQILLTEKSYMSHHWVSNQRHFNSLGHPASTEHLSHHNITLVAWQTQSDLAPATLLWQPCFLPWFHHLLPHFRPGCPTCCPPCSLAALAALLAALTALLSSLAAPFVVVLTVILLYVMCCTVTKLSLSAMSQITCSQPWIRLENIIK